ncbi:MobF family relaxase [Nocardia sp. alder85J]|uniref:MobF family relaxase n=1 Tax=Nocardia sp. alder85J TaxID=2862949 RepID=UPI001CD789FA|nr:MobF family relaxase [Nocardia sp. alder85J]MCX4097939.1 relaxase domain-containing protein [Nocardia sp. alder85J]
MTATLHKVMAGNGYLYYLRQTAAYDVSDRGSSSLSDYYSARGEAPGRWHGDGLSALGIQPGDEVTEAQMKALWGVGRHPNADAIEAQVITAEIAAGAKPGEATRAAERASRLGNPYRMYSGGSEFRRRSAEAFAAFNTARGHDPHAAIPEADRARLRTRVAREMFADRYGRAPLDQRELSGWVAQISRPSSAAVAGFDITFSPVKSVSVLWAVAPRETGDLVQAAHEAAVDDALTWLQQHALYTRLGRNGVRQVEVEGMVAARFLHRDSRCGDPDLHTHVLIANRVRTLDGRWRTLDGAMIYRAVVTVSEIYNTRLEAHLERLLGVTFTERPGTDPSKRPIREIVGIPMELIEHWSQRDAAITRRLGELSVAFQQQLGREPMPAEMYRLAERATLETRPAKHGLRTRAEQHADWRAHAATILGGRDALAHMLSAVTNGSQRERPVTDRAWLTAAADRVVAQVSAQRSVWQRHHLRSEIERHIRGRVAPHDVDVIADQLEREALSPSRVIARGNPDAAAHPVLRRVPAMFAHRDGSSVHAVAGAQHYTTASALDIGARLIDLSLQPGGRALTPDVLAAAVDAYQRDPAHRDRQLNEGQLAVLTMFAHSPMRIHTANAPAGTGKTTTMRVLVDAWHRSGGTVVGLTPTAAAADVLRESTSARAETVDKLLTVLAAHTPGHAHDTDRRGPPPLPQWVLDIGPSTLVLVDEHIQLADAKRVRLLEFLASRDATVRCLGDDRQLPAIDAADAATDMAEANPPATLTQVVRFASPGEAAACLQLRDGDPAGLGWYLDNGRIHTGSPAATCDDAYTAWIDDHISGHDALMLAPTHDIVRELNHRARSDRLARTHHPPGPNTLLSDTNYASAGDLICTRRNNPRLRVGDTDWVRNGYRWTVTTVHPDGSLTARRLHAGHLRPGTVHLPADYLRAHVRLGYAVTINAAQGLTVDTCHVALTGRETHNQLYVALTRGVHANHAYVPTALDGSEASFWTEPAVLPRTAVEILCRILGRDTTPMSPYAELRTALDPARRLGRAVDIYLDAVGMAAEHAVGDTVLARLDAAAETIDPHLTDSPSYPVLRQHLAILATRGRDPVAALHMAATERELDTATDIAAVLDRRLDPTGRHSTGTGPLPWTHCFPNALGSEHLHARAHIIADLAAQIAHDTAAWTPVTAPRWAQPLLHSDPRLLADLAVWRAAHHIDDTDTRPTGPPRYPALERIYQQLLDARVTDTIGDLHYATHTWSALAKRLDARLLTDPYWPVLADKIDLAARAGLPIETLLGTAAASRPLPDDMPAAALWSRLQIEPAALHTTTDALRPYWTPQLAELLGTDTADLLINDPAWPRLVAAIDHATASGWTPRDILATAYELLLGGQADTGSIRPHQLTTALAWRAEALLHTDIGSAPVSPADPIPDTAPEDPFDEPLRTLTDTELIQQIDDLHQRLTLADTYTFLFSSDEPSESSRLRAQLDGLHAERDRRHHLTPDQLAAERKNRHATDPTGENSVEPHDLGHHDPTIQPPHDIGP